MNAKIFALAISIPLTILLLLMCAWPELAYAQISDQEAVACVIGEAEDQGYEGMLAVSGALRNRGTTKGVYGCRSKRVINKMYSQKTYRLAERAWYDSQFKDITNNATHWENVKAFGKPYWAESMIATVLIVDHQFYKEK